MTTISEQRPVLSEIHVSMYLSYYIDTLRRCGGVRGTGNQRWITALDESVIDHIDDVIDHYNNGQYTVYAEGHRWAYETDAILRAFTPTVWKKLIDYNMNDGRLHGLKHQWVQRGMELGVFPTISREEQLYMLAEALQHAAPYDVASWPAWWNTYQHLFQRYATSMNDLMDAARCIPEARKTFFKNFPWVILYIQSKMAFDGRMDISSYSDRISTLLCTKSNALKAYNDPTGHRMDSNMDIEEFNHWWQRMFQHLMDHCGFTLDTFLEYIDTDVRVHANMDYPYALIQPVDTSGRIALLLFHGVSKQFPDRLSANAQKWLHTSIAADPQICAWLESGALNIWNIYADATHAFNPLTDFEWATEMVEFDEARISSERIARMIAFFETLHPVIDSSSVLDTRSLDL